MFVETGSGCNVTSENISKKSTIFFGFRLKSQDFRHLLQKPKLKLMASLSSNHSLDLYLPKRPCLNELQNEYGVKTKVIALD